MKLRKNVAFNIVNLTTIAALLAGCDMFTKEKIPLSGKRESVLSIDSTFLPDPTVQHVSFVLPGAERNKDWPQAGGNPTHVMPHLRLPENLDVVWSVNVGNGTSEDHRVTAGPVIADGRVYVCDALGKISAISVKDGQILWTMDSVPEGHASEAIGGGVAYDNGLVYCASSYGELIALQASDGKILWRKPLGAPSRIAPTIKDGMVYAQTINNELHAFRAKTGEATWNHTGISEAAGILGGASPAVSGRVVIAAYSSGEIFAFDVDSGQPIWGDLLNPALRIDSVASIAHIRARPVISGDTVYVISHGGQMVAQDLRTGDRLWQREVAGIRTPAVISDAIFIVTNGSDLLGMKKATGQIAWAVPLQKVNEDKKAILWAGPVIAGNSLILAGSNGDLVFVSPRDGKIQKTITMSSGSSLSPVVADGALYILSDNGDLIKYAEVVNAQK